MSVGLEIREARPEDWPAREQLVREGMLSHCRDAFIFFFFHEVMVQVCVVFAALLYICAGWGAAGAGCGAAGGGVALLAVCVRVWHEARARTHVQRMRSEQFGLVAVLSTHTRKPHVVGTVSVSDHWEEPYSAWMHALAVRHEHRGGGLGKLLVRGAVRTGRTTRVCTALSQLQPAARELLHKEGWRGGWYARRLIGTLTLPLVSLSVCTTRLD